MCHHTIVERIGGDKDAWTQWTDWINEDPQPWRFPDLPYAAAAAVGDVVHGMLHGGQDNDDRVPAGWDAAVLLRQMERANST